jgi:sugar O-acyltransferase (sialic acid O-acetyltransferase NeuD family)
MHVDEITDVVLWGATGQAKVLRELLAARGKRVSALFDDTPDLVSPFPGVPLYRGSDGFERWLGTVADPSGIGFIVAIGGEHGAARVRIHRLLASRGLAPVTAVHPTAFVAPNATLGSGCQILAQSAVAVDCRLGEACIVNTSATIDHEGVLGDGVHIAGGARLAGLVRVDDYATIYTGASILPRVRIGTGAVVGAGAVVLHDVAPWTVVVGVPARAVGRREERRP